MTQSPETGSDRSPVTAAPAPGPAGSASAAGPAGPAGPDGPAAGQPGAAAASTAAARASRLAALSGDMVRSMLVIVAIVVVLLLIVPRPNKVPTRALDVPAAASQAVSQLGFTPSVPKNLPDGWTAVAADVQKATDNIPTWHLSYLTPKGNYAGVQQAANPTAAWEGRQVTDGADQGEHQVAGRSWVVRSRTDRGITSWVLREPDRTTVVTGTADQAELDELATATIG